MSKTTDQPGTEAGPEVNSQNGHATEPNPFSGNPAALERERQRREVKAATEGREKQWRFHFYAVEEVPRNQAWGRKLRRGLTCTDPVKYPPTLIFSGEQAVKAGATDEQLQALPALTPGRIAELKERQAAEHEAVRIRVRALAREIEAARAADAIDIPDRIDLSTYTPPMVTWLIEGLVPMNKILGLFAERKAGKTTAAVELARAVLSGEDFLGRFSTHLPSGARVVLLDTEMGADMMQHECTTAGVEPLDRLDLYDLRGRSRTLDMRDDATRSRWRDQIAPGSVVIVDCLYTVLSAVGIDENSAQVSDVIEGFKTLAVESEAAGLVIVHHLGKNPEMGARGHSSIEGAVDTIATIRLDGPPAASTPRIFTANGRRGVDVTPGTLTLDNGRLILGGNPYAERRAAAHHAADEAVWCLIDANPDLSVRKLFELPDESRGKLSRDHIRDAVNRLTLTNRIVNKGSKGAPKWRAVEGIDPCLTLA